MKVKVITPFKDKVTGKTHNTGAEIEVSKERFEEIKKAGRYVVEVPEEGADKKATRTVKK